MGCGKKAAAEWEEAKHDWEQEIRNDRGKQKIRDVITTLEEDIIKNHAFKKIQFDCIDSAIKTLRDVIGMKSGY